MVEGELEKDWLVATTCGGLQLYRVPRASRTRLFDTL